MHLPWSVPLFLYTAARIGLFTVAFLVLANLGAGVIVAAVGAAVIAFCISYLALGRLRGASESYLARRSQERARGIKRFSKGVEEDAAVEDSAVDAAQGGGAEGGGAGADRD